ncbi:hypothetical protein ACXPWS_16300 [Mycobacterium sp. BMJ-28]
MSIAPGKLAAAVLTGAGGMAGMRSARTGLKLSFPSPGRCPEQPTLLMCVFDDSGSMLGGNDSAGLRYEEAALAVQAVGKRCRCGAERVAVLHMNRPTTADLDPTPIQPRHWPDIDTALDIPADTDGASMMIDTLQRAASIAGQHTGHRIVLLAFSDFELFEDLQQLAVALTVFPGKAHAVVMRSHPPAIFAEYDAITVTHVPTGQEPGLVARTVFDVLTGPRRPDRGRR